MPGKIAVVLGIRPDVIRASIVLEKLRHELGQDLVFIWSGQHYSDNLKDIFFRELEVPPPDIELGAGGETDAEVCGTVITRLYPVLQDLQPTATVFLGDTNTVMGCLAAGQLNIPVVHIEGCMRSYDWRMPEEKYRTVTDHLSDVIYAYLPEYKVQGVAEGLNPESIVVVGNPIVDVLNRYYHGRVDYFDRLASDRFFSDRGLSRGKYSLMTCHRRENVHAPESLRRIINLVGSSDQPVYFPASYRTQRQLKEFGVEIPGNLLITDPIGYEEFLALLVNSSSVFTDSGTVVEESCILGIPSVQMRRSTERPQVYDVRSSVKFDPAARDASSPRDLLEKLATIQRGSWEQPFGDGRSSERIAADLLDRLASGTFYRHDPSDYPQDVSHSYRSDGV